MKKTNMLKLALGAGIFLATLSIDLGGSLSLINSSYGRNVDPEKDEKESEATGTCPDGRTITGIVCVVGKKDCKPTFDCDKPSAE